MRKIGIYAVLIGLALLILPYFGLTLRLFEVVDELGETPALLVKTGLIVVGGILFFVGKPSEEEVAETIEEPAE